MSGVGLGLVTVCGSVFVREVREEKGSADGVSWMTSDAVGVVAGTNVGGVGDGLVVAVCDEMR